MENGSQKRSLTEYELFRKRRHNNMNRQERAKKLTGYVMSVVAMRSNANGISISMSNTVGNLTRQQLYGMGTRQATIQKAGRTWWRTSEAARLWARKRPEGWVRRGYGITIRRHGTSPFIDRSSVRATAGSLDKTEFVSIPPH
jgi:hypothetical protein